MERRKTVLIVGASGFIGTHLALALRDSYKVFGLYYKNAISIPGVTFLPANILMRDWLKRIVYRVEPEVIIYAAGAEDWEWAEAHPKMAEGVHAGGCASIVTLADIFQPKSIFISNAYVFDGHRGNYTPEDTVLPNIVLGKVKASGENYIRGRSLNHLILRVSNVFGRGNGVNQTSLDRLRQKLDRGERLEMSTQELHSYCPVYGVIDVLLKLIESGARNRIFHYGGLTKVTPFQFAQAFAKKFGYDENLITPKSSFEASGDGPAYDFSLNSTDTIEALNVQSFLLEEGFELLQEKLVATAG